MKTKTFNEFWIANGVKPTAVITPILTESYRQLALQAWNAAIDAVLALDCITGLSYQKVVFTSEVEGLKHKENDEN